MTVASIPGLNLTGLQAGNQPPVGSASQALSQVTSQEWNTWLQNFVPEENLLIQYAMNPNLAATNMNTAIQQQTQQNAQATGIQERRLAQFDTSLTPEQRQAVNKGRGISNALSVVDSANRAKDFTVAQQMGILGAANTGITGSV